MLSSYPEHKHVQLLHVLHHLPRKVMTHQEKENLAAYVLHELCHESIFNVNKAAYLVNNSDFNCMRGVTGYEHNDAFNEFDAHWNQPDAFSLHLKNSEFNTAVREIFSQALTRNDHSESRSVLAIAENLGIEHPAYISWDLKHNNHGYLLYERPDHHDEETRAFLSNGLFLLSFCPIF